MVTLAAWIICLPVILSAFYLAVMLTVSGGIVVVDWLSPRPIADKKPLNPEAQEQEWSNKKALSPYMQELNRKIAEQDAKNSRR